MDRRFFVALALVAAACETPTAPPPLRVTPAAMTQFRSLCLTPLRSEVDDPPRVARMETMLEDGLRARGFGVVSASETGAALDRIAREEGGLYDVDTGARRPDFQAVSQRVRERAGAELSCQAMLRARVVFVVAPWVAKAGMFSEGTASWDGLEVDLGAGRNAAGSIGALSLHVRVLDLSERELYFGTGGIRTTSVMRDGFVATTFEPVDPKELLADASRNHVAIDLALKDLRLGPAPAAPSGPSPRAE
jgi:hypothetical protein